MKFHLTDEQIAAWLAGEADEQARRHAAECARCAAELKALGAGVGAYREALRARTAKVVVRQPERRPLLWFRWALVAVLVLIVIAIGVMRPSPKPQPQVTVNKVDDARDDALLLQVDEAVHREVAPALQPAMALVQERERANKKSSVQQ